MPVRVQVLRLLGDDFVLVIDGVPADEIDSIRSLELRTVIGARGVLVFPYPVELVQ